MHESVATMCPTIAAPCPQLPKFDWGQKNAFCNLCGKHVHNLSAMTRAEQDNLLHSQASPCIRYARLIPVAVLLLATSGAILAQDTPDSENLGPIEVLGGRRSGPILEPMFLQSELDADTPLDEANAEKSDESLDQPQAQPEETGLAK